MKHDYQNKKPSECNANEPSEKASRKCSRCDMPVDNPWLTRCPRCLAELDWINPCEACAKQKKCGSRIP